MPSIRFIRYSFLLGLAVTAAAYGQSPNYGTPQPPPQDYEDRGHDDRGYDDRGYDDRGINDRDYDDHDYDATPSPRGEVGFFYDELSPYGDWVLTRDHGWAWFPRTVRADWRPYSDGRWVVTDYGWTWASNEPFGWATYHYGRWAWDSRFGWLWVPGTIWGPAWVSWQYGGGYVGWAPLPPAVGFEIGVGIRLGGFNLSLGIRPDTYSFVRERSLLEPRLSGYLEPRARNVTIIHETTNITNYTFVENHVVNRGVEVRRIEQITGRRVRERRINQTATAPRNRTEVADREVRIYRPEKRKLDAVRVGPRANAGLPPEAPKVESIPAGRARPPAERRATPDFEVAPRAGGTPRPDPRTLDKKDSRERQELEKYQANEQRRLDKRQSEDSVKPPPKVDRQKVVDTHRNERAAQQEEQQTATRQLEARQKVQREAARTNEARDKAPAERQRAPKKQEPKKPRPQGGQGEKPDGPPPTPNRLLIPKETR